MDYAKASKTGGHDPQWVAYRASRGRKEYANFYYFQQTLTVVKSSCNSANRRS